MWLILFFFSYRYSTASESAVIKGTIAKKIPAYVELKKDKTYSWCACGLSKKQVILVIILLFVFFIWLSLKKKCLYLLMHYVVYLVDVFGTNLC